MEPLRMGAMAIPAKSSVFIKEPFAKKMHKECPTPYTEVRIMNLLSLHARKSTKIVYVPVSLSFRNSKRVVAIA